MSLERGLTEVLKPDTRLVRELSRQWLNDANTERELGWLAIASGVGLALSRISWTSYIWLPFYLMFWLWVITVAVLLLRRNFRGVAQSG